GRVSLFEPINRYGTEHRTRETLWGFPVDGLGEVRDKLNAVFDAIQGPDDPMLDFDERDLVRLAVDAGFFPVELDLQIEVVSIDAMSWERCVNVAGNPNIPSLAEAMEEALDAGERARLERHLRPLVERGEGVGRWAAAKLPAPKPG